MTYAGGLISVETLQEGMDLSGGPLEYAEVRLEIARAVTQFGIVYQAVQENERRVRMLANDSTQREIHLRLNRWFAMHVPTELYPPRQQDNAPTLSIYDVTLQGMGQRPYAIVSPNFSFAAVFESTFEDSECHIATPREMASGRGYGVDRTLYAEKAAAAFKFVSKKILP